CDAGAEGRLTTATSEAVPSAPRPSPNLWPDFRPFVNQLRAEVDAARAGAPMPEPSLVDVVIENDPSRCEGCGAIEHSGNAFCGPCSLVEQTVELYREPSPETLEALKDVERVPETLGVVALAEKLAARDALKCGGVRKNHKWGAAYPQRCMKCGADRRERTKKHETAGASPAPSSSESETHSGSAPVVEA